MAKSYADYEKRMKYSGIAVVILVVSFVILLSTVGSLKDENGKYLASNTGVNIVGFTGLTLFLGSIVSMVITLYSAYKTLKLYKTSGVEQDTKSQ